MSIMADAPASLKSTVVFQMQLEQQETYPKLDSIAHLSEIPLLQQKKPCIEIHKEHSAIVTRPKVVRVVQHVQLNGEALAIEPCEDVRRPTPDGNTEHPVARNRESTLGRCSNESVAIKLAHDVVALTFTTCGSYLAIADESGVLHLYKADGTLLLTHPIITGRDNSDRLVSMKFASKSYSAQLENLIMVTSDGVAIHISDISMLKLETLLQANDGNALSPIVEQIQLLRTNVGSLDSGAHSLLLAHQYRSACVFLLANHEYNLTAWQANMNARLTLENGKTIDQLAACRIPSSLAVASMKFVPDRKFILVLTTDGKISWWDWYGMIFYFQLGISSILSFNIIDSFQHYSHVQKTVIGITRLLSSETHAIKVELIEVFRSPSGQGYDYRTIAYLEDIKYSEPYVMGVSSHECDVLRQPFIVIDRTLQNLSVIRCNLHQDSSACRNSSPNCSNHMSSASTAEKKENAVHASFRLLNLPVDAFFHSTEGQMLQYKLELESCIQSIGQDDEDSRTILRHLCALASKLRAYSAMSSSPSLPDHMLKWCDHVNDTKSKWTTFELLRSSYVEGLNDNMTLREKWLLFSQRDVICLLDHYMRKGAMRAVMILWRRHINDKQIMMISELLSLLPLSLSITVYENWMKSEVIPAIFRLSETHSLVVQDFARWALKRAEIAATQNDLDTAIRFATILHDTVKPTNSECFRNFNFHAFKENDGFLSCELSEKEDFDPFQRLTLLKEKLQHIQYLSKTHGFSVTLARFNDESSKSIAKCMLERVSSSELLVGEITRHVKTYLTYCGIDPDPVLSSYVIELAEALHNPNQETRALVVLEAIDDIGIRVDTTLVVLGSSRPPYSIALKNHAQSTKLLNSNRKEQVEHFIQLMNLQDMLVSYGIKKFNVGDTRGATRLLHHILGQISRPTVFDDALCLVNAYGHLRSTHAASRYVENLLMFPLETTFDDDRAFNEAVSAEVNARIIRAIDAIRRAGKCEENPMIVLLLAENITQFGVKLLEMKETHQTEFPFAQRKSYVLDGTIKVDNNASFLLSMILGLVEILLTDIQALKMSAMNECHEKLLTFIDSPNFLLSTNLLSDLQKLKRIETEWGILLSIRTLRDPDKREAMIRFQMKPDVIFASDFLGSGYNTDKLNNKLKVTQGVAGKKRASQPHNYHEIQPPPLKTHRSSYKMKSGKFTCAATQSDQLQQGDEEAQSMANLSRFSSSLGIPPSEFHCLIAQCAADNGSILRAVRFSRNLFSRTRERTRKTHAFSNTKPFMAAQEPSAFVNCISQTFSFASTLKNISLSISKYTATNVDNLYGCSNITQTRTTSAELARLRAPLYSMELLQYSICVCDTDSFEETLLLLKNATLLNEVLRFTELDFTTYTSDHGILNWRLYSHFYRSDPCVLPCAQTMLLASRFVIAEHRKLINRLDFDDLTPSRRYISFLLDNSATLLSLQVLLSMRIIPEDAYGVIQIQLGKLLSTVFQSHYIDNQLALGLMLTMEQVNAFNEFRAQISRENIAKDFKRFQQLAFIGSDAARAWQQIAFLLQCVELEGNARWWHYLNLLGIECDHKAFKGDSRDLGYIRSLVPALLIKSNFDFYTVLDFTRHYHLDDSYPSVTYVEMLLLEKDPASEVKSRSLAYQDKIVGVLDDIHDQQLVTVLLQCLPQIGGTDYGRIMFVFQVLLQHTTYPYKEEVKRRIKVLQILQQFAHSTSEPNKFIQNGTQLQNGGIKDISFHDLMVNPLKALGAHLQKENISFLVALSSPLHLKSDEIYMLLLKNMVEDLFGSCGDAIKSQNVNLNSHPTVTFDTFHDVLSQIADEENMITTAEWLAEQFPIQKEKLKTLEFALGVLTLEQESKRGNSSRVSKPSTGVTNHASVAQKTLARLKSKILRVKIEIILQAATIQKQKLLDFVNEHGQRIDDMEALASKPQELFFEIYRRFTLAFAAEGNDTLHQVADNIADLLQITADELRMQLINEWLISVATDNRKNTVTTEAESIFEYLPIEVKQQEDEDSIIRTLYVAVKCISDEDNQTSRAQELISFLMKFAREVKPRAGVTHRAKRRALIVLLRLSQVEHSTFSKYIAHNLPQLNEDAADFLKEAIQYTRHCKYMAVFEEHHVPFDMSFLLKTNKEALVRSLLRQFPTKEPWVLECASQWMLDFEVDVADIWESVLANMRSHGMKRFLLMHVLEPLSRKCFTHRLEHGSELWEEILLSPLLQLKCAQRRQHQQLLEHPIDLNLSLDEASPHLWVTKFKSENPNDENKRALATESEMTQNSFCGYSIASVRIVLNQMVRLLQICPFLDQVDVPAFVIHLRDLTSVAETDVNGSVIASSLDLYQLAAKCAMTIPKPAARFQALTRIVQAGAYIPVLRELSDIACFLSGDRIENENDEGEFSEQLCLAQTIFAEVATRGSYQQLMQSEYKNAFLEYLAATKNIDGALAILLSEHRLEVASRVVELLHEFNPTEAPTSDVPTADQWHSLKMYVTASTSSCLEVFRKQL